MTGFRQTLIAEVSKVNLTPKNSQFYSDTYEKQIEYWCFHMVQQVFGWWCRNSKRLWQDQDVLRIQAAILRKLDTVQGFFIKTSY